MLIYRKARYGNRLDVAAFRDGEGLTRWSRRLVEGMVDEMGRSENDEEDE